MNIDTEITLIEIAIPIGVLLVLASLVFVASLLL